VFAASGNVVACSPCLLFSRPKPYIYHHASVSSKHNQSMPMRPCVFKCTTRAFHVCSSRDPNSDLPLHFSIFQTQLSLAMRLLRLQKKPPISSVMFPARAVKRIIAEILPKHIKSVMMWSLRLQNQPPALLMCSGLVFAVR
jgi:hypothetical protein